ncbi:MAG: dihydrolipoyl dehydrogenase [Candidatus Sericytochromatia bacterium]|nr:dihydrolipoyl dehydrogenase [Candidatus Sericytochromatia bacterium]
MSSVIVVGGGPGGYVAAIRAAQLGLQVTLVEREWLGGVCLNWGCIPTKALLRNAEVLNLFKHAKDWGVAIDGLKADYGVAFDRSRQVADKLVKGIQYLMKKNGIRVVQGRARVLGAGRVQVGAEVLQAAHIILAVGARPRLLPGIEPDGRRVVTSRAALLDNRSAPESILILGGGAIGCEFAYVYGSYGANVTLVEAREHLLPNEDPESSEVLEKSYRAYGYELLLSSRFEGHELTPHGVKAKISTPEGLRTIEAERMLVALGISPNTEELGLEAAGVATERGFITVDEQMRTNVPGIWAVGDCNGRSGLAHVASAQGVVAAEAIAGHRPPELRYADMPRCTYCHPQVASLGLTEAQARDAGYDVQVGRFPLAANGKALALGDATGQVKVVVDGQYGELLGVHLVGPDVTELLPEFGLARAAEATTAEIEHAVHAHPTLSEALHEAVLSAMGRAVHV